MGMAVTMIDEGHGYDVFGLHPPSAERMARWLRPIAKHYFQLTAVGAEQLPGAGPAILVPNHGGTLPLDAALLWLDAKLRLGRWLRVVADRFVPLLPIVSTVFARCGVVSGTQTNVRRLLERNELIAIFPEGVSGPAKPARDRYQLQQWNVGHVELAIRHRVPVVPVAIIGVEESWPVLVKLHVHVFGSPYLPVPRAPLPLPHRVAIHYGAPITFPGVDADDPVAVAEAAARTRSAVAALVERNLT